VPSDHWVLGRHRQLRITLNPGFAFMSATAAIFDVPHAHPPQGLSAPVREVRAELRPWGFWGSLGWGLFALGTGLFAGVIYTAIWTLTHQLHIPDPKDPAFATVAGMVVSVVPLAVLVISVKSRKFSLRDYFALHRIPRRDLALGIACLTVLIVVVAAIELLLGIDGGSKSVETTYQAAKLAGMLPMLWLTTVVMAPVTEELLFRGFLHRGWVASWLGVSGTIALTSALWAALHQQYNWLGILRIFLMGLIFGWVRQRSGSTTLTIVLHTVNNLVAMILVAVRIEGLS
jgi:membrane protease YdiL (CAAX protease family)